MNPKKLIEETRPLHLEKARGLKGNSTRNKKIFLRTLDVVLKGFEDLGYKLTATKLKDNTKT